MGAALPINPVNTELQQNHLPPAKLPQPRKSLVKPLLLLLILVAAGVLGWLLYQEAQSSAWQAKLISRYAKHLTYKLQPGPSDQVRYPQQGPFDARLGYVMLPQLLQRSQTAGFDIVEQARFSPDLLAYTAKGLFPPYPEKTSAGLDIADCRGDAMYRYRFPRLGYANFEAIPPHVAQALLFIENRDLLDPEHPQLNPAVDWERFAKAAVLQVAEAAGLEVPSMGGSTLATQIEKYRHSPDGVTSSIKDKLTQMASASVRAYQSGPNTLPARQRLVLSYLNTVPLSAAPGYGEVNGLGDGLRVWFGADFAEVNRLLSLPDGDATVIRQQGLALRQVIALMIAHRRPSYYLAQGRQDLAQLTDSYLRIMAQAGAISSKLRDAGLAQRVSFRDFIKYPAARPVETNKGINAIRTRLSGLLGVPLYDLDRIDLATQTTLQQNLQTQAGDYLRKLSDKDFAQQVGLFGERLLTPGQQADVRYSFTLFERTADGNRVRVQTDNTDQPFDINEGSKLELGSTAKLRVLASYLEIISELYQRYVGMQPDALRKVSVDPQDALSRWVVDYLLSDPADKSLQAILMAALERHYSASPKEVFFTGGGIMTFGNFRRDEDDSNPTVREAVRESVNLSFVRILRDIVRYTMVQSLGDRSQILGDDKDPRRAEYLQRFADREGLAFLTRFWRKYQDKKTEERVDTFLDGLKQTPVRLAAVHRYLFPDADEASFSAFLKEQLPDADLTPHYVEQLYKKYGPGAFNLQDQGYIARVHPLELWLVGYLIKHPQAKYGEAVAASREQRQEVYSWLYRTRAKNARDSRIRTMMEVQAFLEIHQRWKRLGYPFDHLVPSLATALGSSGDRPAALAELMGIIMNNGIRLPTVRIDNLHFAANTPYESRLERQSVMGERVMAPEIAVAMRSAIMEVVAGGTARRLQGAYTLPDGSPMPMGGKTGTGDNRLVAIGPGGVRMQAQAASRTATFVFFLGSNHFGTLTAFVPGKAAADFRFTSALTVQVLKGMAPILQPYLTPGQDSLCRDGSPPPQVAL